MSKYSLYDLAKETVDENLEPDNVIETLNAISTSPLFSACYTLTSFESVASEDQLNSSTQGRQQLPHRSSQVLLLESSPQRQPNQNLSPQLDSRLEPQHLLQRSPEKKLHKISEVLQQPQNSPQHHSLSHQQFDQRCQQQRLDQISPEKTQPKKSAMLQLHQNSPPSRTALQFATARNLIKDIKRNNCIINRQRENGLKNRYYYSCFKVPHRTNLIIVSTATTGSNISRENTA
ncbi:hypothetical protein Anas_11791 [Armadillidium nasatum]|uniref:Uncharacterized protein n=1 Tax=Armadillidium nasatum TaxID=96803 RepID=A0A5N5T3V0_9CRUS|nr:hypothetical protein Anas_11791 [Armadillidium nasatum]